MSHLFTRNWCYRGMLWLVMLALLVGPSAAGGASGAAPAEQPAGPRLYLVADTFDPLQRAPRLDAALVNDAAAAGMDGAYLVQFTGPVQPAWVQAVKALGAQVGPYIPDHAFIMQLDAAIQAQVESLSFVRWVGPFHPAYRLSPRADGLALSSYRVLLLPWADVAAVREGLSAVAHALSGAERVQQYAPDGFSVVLDEAGAAQAARLPGVLWVEPVLLNELYNDVAGGIMNAPTAWSQGLDGSGTIVGVVDTGLDLSHPDFEAERVLHTESYPVLSGYYEGCEIANVGEDDGVDDLGSGHGTHVTGSLAGSGAMSGGAFKGTAYNASLVFQAVEQTTLFYPSCPIDGAYLLSGIPTDVGVLLEDAYSWGVRVHNNSWGARTDGAYVVDSQNFDAHIAEYGDLLVTVAAGNSGRDGSPTISGDEDGFVDEKSISSLGAAKNVLTVGASDSERLDLDGDKIWYWFFDPIYNVSNFPLDPTRSDQAADSRAELAAFSSRGPTADGRIKPDLVAPGTNIISTLAEGIADITPGWGVYNSFYMYNGGTSMSSPLVAGAAALVRDYYIQQMQVAKPSAALIKATLINTAVDIPGYGYAGFEAAQRIPNMHEGWGRINVGAAVTTGTRQFVDDWGGLTTNGVKQWTFGVADTRSFKVSLVWSDVEGSTTALKALVNDLDLEVIAPDSVTVYRGNEFEDGWSVTGGLPDRVNNVENVYIQAPAAGLWTVKVKGYTVPWAPQPFALVVDGDLVGHPQPGAITPTTGVNDAPVNDVLITGSFLTGATSVRLVMDGETIAGTGITGSDTQLTVDFDLTGATPGWYDLEVTNILGTGNLSAAFAVLDADLPDLRLSLDPLKIVFEDGEPITFTLRLENNSGVLASDVTFTQTLPEGFSLLEVVPGCLVDPTLLPDGYRCQVGEMAASAVMTYTVTVEATGAPTGVYASEAEVGSAAVDRWEADNFDLAQFLLDPIKIFLPLTLR